MSGSAGHVMNLANSIIGVGLLAMPFCFKQCGITLAIAMLILSSIISRLACHFLIKSSALCRRRNFEFLAFYAFGPSGKLLVELGIIGFMMGTCVAFFVVMGDLGPAIASKILNVSNNSTLRTCVLIALGLLVILPLGLLRNIESLVAISTVTIGFYFLFTLKIFFESSQHLFAGDWWPHVNFWNPEGVLQCIPIFAMSLSCQTQLFEIYESLSAPTSDKINSVVHSAINLCTVVYASVGFLGYIAYCKATFTGNILLSFTPSLTSEMFKLGFVMSIAVSFPLVIFPCRASLYSLIFKRMPIHHEASQMSSHIPDSRFKWLTIGIVTVSLVTGLLIPSIELVLGFVGSTIGIAICVIFPSLSYLNLSSKNADDKTIAKITVVVGILIMIMGTFGNLLAAVEKGTADFRGSSPKIFNSKVLPPFDAKAQHASVKKLTESDAFSSGRRTSLTKEFEGIERKEPPVPVAPGLEPRGSKKATASNQPSLNRIGNKMRQPKSKISVKFSEAKPNENISKDAIEKEEREIMEVEKEKKAEEKNKDRELLQALKEQQEEQKKLLQKQEKLLMEMKNRERKNEEKLNKILKEQSNVKTFPDASKPDSVKKAEKSKAYGKAMTSSHIEPGKKGGKTFDKIKLNSEIRNITGSNNKKTVENDNDNVQMASRSSALVSEREKVVSKRISNSIEKKLPAHHDDSKELELHQSEGKRETREKRNAYEVEENAKTEKCSTTARGDKNGTMDNSDSGRRTKGKSEGARRASMKIVSVPLIKSSERVSLNGVAVARDQNYGSPNSLHNPKSMDVVLMESSVLGKKRDLKIVPPSQNR